MHISLPSPTTLLLSVRGAGVSGRKPRSFSRKEEVPGTVLDRHQVRVETSSFSSVGC